MSGNMLSQAKGVGVLVTFISIIAIGVALVALSASPGWLEAIHEAGLPWVTPQPVERFYGAQFVPVTDLELVKGLGIDVVLNVFQHDESPETWLAYLDAAQEHEIQVVAWLWPAGWTWDGETWQIDDQARTFVQTVAGHPALMAVYTLHEPYYNDCFGCGYTTAQQQALYTAVKEIASVPIWSEVDGIAFWTAQGEETAFADGVCDYCGTGYYPFLEGDVYERKELIARLNADLAVAEERAPNSKIVWNMQVFAQSALPAYRMPTEEEMRDLAALVYRTDIAGAMWYPWTFNTLYDDYLSNHPELYPVVQDIGEQVVHRYR
jgi:hypothetical protein